jgi:glycerol uptake facilitator protein
MSPFFAEFFGTAMIIVFGGGVVSNVLLNKTKGNNSGWIVITFGWAIGVFTGVLIAAPYSGAHLNPAVTLALVIVHKFSLAQLPVYVAAQVLGAMFGAGLVGWHIKSILMPQKRVIQSWRYSVRCLI